MERTAAELTDHFVAPATDEPRVIDWVNGRGFERARPRPPGAVMDHRHYEAGRIAFLAAMEAGEPPQTDERTMHAWSSLPWWTRDDIDPDTTAAYQCLNCKQFMVFKGRGSHRNCPPVGYCDEDAQT
jgi:hypothetical protein